MWQSKKLGNFSICCTDSLTNTSANSNTRGTLWDKNLKVVNFNQYLLNSVSVRRPTENNLLLYIKKIKELVAYFRKKEAKIQLPVYISEAEGE